MRTNSIWSLISHLAADYNFEVDRVVNELLQRMESEDTQGPDNSRNKHNSHPSLKPASPELAS
ncbi:MAG: hypothetical protein R6U22_09575 [Desulfohalobiaceae bacterium]